MFTDWDDFMKKSDSELLNTVLKFSGMYKGILTYTGKYKDKDVLCQVTEDCISNFEFAPEETIGELSSSLYTYIAISGDVILDTF